MGTADNASRQLKASAESVGVNCTNTLTNGSKYRALVYDDKGKLVVQKVYTVGKNIPDDGEDLQLNGGSTYKFIVYSYNTSEVPAAVNATDATTNVSGNKDLLYFTKNITVSGGATNDLDIVFKHKYSKVNISINSNDIGPISKIQASFTPHYVSNRINLLTGAIEYDKTAVNLPIDNLSGDYVTIRY